MNIQPPVLEVYYAPSCAPCRLELPVIAEFSRHDGIHIRIIVVSEPQKALAELKTAGLDRFVAVSPAESPRETLCSAGNPDGILPYARSVNAGGKTCMRWRGRLSLAKVKEMLSACRRTLISPSSHRS